MSSTAATTMITTRPMVGAVVVCACAADKRHERIGGQPDHEGTGGPHQ